ncbi:MAG: DinB family protein [Reichenbachiella sp.]
MMISKPELSEYNSFYKGYINLVLDKNILDYLKNQLSDMLDLFKGLPSDKIDYSYAERKWSIKQLFRHMIDAERVFAYRILALSRLDTTSLPGFDENEYADQSNDSKNTMDELIEEFEFLRKSNISMIDNLDPTVLTFVGTVNGSPTSCRALIYILAGHIAHHLNIIHERYLTE